MFAYPEVELVALNITGVAATKSKKKQTKKTLLVRKKIIIESESDEEDLFKTAAKQHALETAAAVGDDLFAPHVLSLDGKDLFNGNTDC